MTLENYVPRENDVVLVKLYVARVDPSKKLFMAVGGADQLAAITTDKVVKLLERTQLTPEEEIARLKEENAKWQKLAEEFRDKCEKLEKFAPSSDWMAGQQ